MTTSELFLDGLINKNLYITNGTLAIVNNEVSITGATITLTNNEIVLEKFALHEELCEEDDLVFGKCNSSSIEFSTVNSYASLKGVTIRVYFVMDNEGTLEAYQIGVYKVSSDVPTADRTHRDIKAYDAMYELANKDVTTWYNTLLPNNNSTTTVKAMRASLLAYCGITEVVRDDLVNDNLQIKRTISPTQLSGLSVIEALCEVNGCFGNIDRQGNFRSVTLAQGIEGLYPALDLYPDPELYPQGDATKPITDSMYFPPCTYEDYLVNTITQIEIRNEDNSIGQTVGTSGNAYVVSGNFLLFGKTGTELTSIGNNLLAQINGLIYRPFDVECLGLPTILIGDAIRLNTTTQVIEGYVLERNLRGIQALRDAYSCRGNEKRESNVNSLSTQITQLNGVVTTIKTDVDGIETEVTNLDTREASHFRQTSSEIDLKVSADEVVSAINLSPEVIKIQSGKIELEGYTTINGGFAVDDYGNVTIDSDRSDGNLKLLDGKLEINTENGSHIRLRDEILIGGGGGKLTTDTYFAHVKPDKIIVEDEINTLIIESNGITIKDDSYDQTERTTLTTTGGMINRNDILTTASSISGSQVSGDASLGRIQCTTLTASSSITLNHSPVLTSSSYITADAVANHSVSSKDGLSASQGGGEVVNDLIYIGSTWRAVSKSYADANYEAKTSDERIKEDIKEIDERYLNALDRVKVKNFRFKNENRKFDKLTHIGVMAQEVLQVLDDCGIDITDQNIIEYREPYSDEQDLVDDGKVYCVNYNQLTSLLIPAYQNLKRENEQLKERLNNLEEILKKKGVI